MSISTSARGCASDVCNYFHEQLLHIVQAPILLFPVLTVYKLHSSRFHLVLLLSKCSLLWTTHLK
jgi:hypothetical protein